MGKEVKEGVPSAAAQEEVAAYELTLDEFCTRLSREDRRVEMIGGFHHTEKQAGRLKDSDAAYAARYAAFQTQPA